MRLRIRQLFQLLVVLALVLGVLPLRAALAQESLSDKQDLVDTATAAGSFTTLLQAVEAAGLVETLKGDGPYTLFAPTDEAFAAVPADALAALLADPAALEQVLLYHVVPGRVIAANIADGVEMATAQGENVTFGFADGKKTVNGAEIIQKDVNASNGVIHVIASVLLPPSMGGAGGDAGAAADAAAAEAAAAAPAAEVPAGGEVIAEGLNGPMGVLVDPNGDIWAIDSGLGGDEPLQVINPETGELVDAALGNTARIVKISAADGSLTEVATVPSVGSEAGASGGNRLALVDGTLYATVGEWLSTPDIDPPPGLATLVTVAEDGTTTEVAQFWPRERDENPDGVTAEPNHSHPFGLIGGPDGLIWVAESGGNNLATVDPATGEISTVAVFDPLPGVFPRPAYDGEMLTDAVPTAVTVGSDGEIYVSLLSGAPFVPGNAKVVQVGADGTVSDYATGLTMLIDLRTGPDGNLYAVSFGVFTEQGPQPNSGGVWRIGEGDQSELVIGGLSFPTSVDFNADGDAFVTTNGVGAPGSGQVVKFAGATAMTGTPLSEVMAAMAPPPAAAPEAAPAEEAPEPVSILDTAAAAGSFNTLAEAVKAAGLTLTLKGGGPFTVFAPTDDAFAAVPQETLDALLADPEALRHVLLYHVVPGQVASADLTDGMTARTAAGEDVSFWVSPDGVKVNTANVVTPDVAASNGIIHVIDSVLIPPSMGGDVGASTAAAGGEAAQEAAPEATPEAMSTETTAPDTLPVTGGANDGALLVLAIGAVVLALGGVAFATRRRTA